MKAHVLAGHHLVRRWFAVVATATLALLGSGCATHYVDTATPEVPVSALKKVDQPKPVQFLFEFQTKGTPNSRATQMLKEQITDQVKTSGLFSSVTDSPAASGAILSMKLNNVPLTDNAFGKGFVTGLTFGLAGSQVTDGYVCTIEYVDGTTAEPITKTARHAIHTVIGAKDAPPNAVAAENIEVAVRTMTRQIVSTVLRDLSFDPSFK